MARQKSEFLSALGTLFEILKALIEEVKSLGGNDEHIRRIGTDQELRKKIAELIVRGGENIVTGSSEVATSNATTYPVEINYTDTFKQRLASGRYDLKDSDITEKNFPVKGDGTVERNLELAHYDKNMSYEAALAAIAAQGYRPANIEELLAFGAKFPELQREFPIVALGSVWQRWFGFRRVACLHRVGDKRFLHLGWLENDWHVVDRFLVVRKSR